MSTFRRGGRRGRGRGRRAADGGELPSEVGIRVQHVVPRQRNRVRFSHDEDSLADFRSALSVHEMDPSPTASCRYNFSVGNSDRRDASDSDLSSVRNYWSRPTPGPPQHGPSFPAPMRAGAFFGGAPSPSAYSSQPHQRQDASLRQHGPSQQLFNYTARRPVPPQSCSERGRLRLSHMSRVDQDRRGEFSPEGPCRALAELFPPSSVSGRESSGEAKGTGREGSHVRAVASPPLLLHSVEDPRLGGKGGQYYTINGPAEEGCFGDETLQVSDQGSRMVQYQYQLPLQQHTAGEFRDDALIDVARCPTTDETGSPVVRGHMLCWAKKPKDTTGTKGTSTTKGTRGRGGTTKKTGKKTGAGKGAKKTTGGSTLKGPASDGMHTVSEESSSGRGRGRGGKKTSSKRGGRGGGAVSTGPTREDELSPKPRNAPPLPPDGQRSSRHVIDDDADAAESFGFQSSDRQQFSSSFQPISRGGDSYNSQPAQSFQPPTSPGAQGGRPRVFWKRQKGDNFGTLTIQHNNGQSYVLKIPMRALSPDEEGTTEEPLLSAKSLVIAVGLFVLLIVSLVAYTLYKRRRRRV